MSKVCKKIIVLNFNHEGAMCRDRLQFNGLEFEITEHRVGWDFEAGREIIARYDGLVDAFALSGVQKRVTAGKTTRCHPGYGILAQSAKKTQIYVADDLRDFFGNWTLQKVLNEDPQFFSARKTLFHSAVASTILKKVLGAGGIFSAADALILAGIPKLLTSTRQLENLLKLASLTRREPHVYSPPVYSQKILKRWISRADVFFTFASLLERIDNLEGLAGKTLVVDYLSPQTALRLQAVELEQVIELVPSRLRSGNLENKSLALVSAFLDLCRISENSLQTFEEYMVNWVQDNHVTPNPIRRINRGVRRCAFIVHALSQKDLWKIPALKSVAKMPKPVRDVLEFGAARLPIHYYGKIEGIRSQLNGQEVVCDIYGMAATPKQLLSMKEDFVYDRLIQGAELAKRRGATLLGLGAYTKVVGDSGVTVARGSPIPVTTGNSFSASTTLWAAREMVDRLGLISTETVGPRLKAKAMIIGATGSIGRVSALLVSLRFHEVVLVATSLDKLMELRQEVLELSPTICVKVATTANGELHDTDLIVIATSNQSGSILDIEKVKPGAVICDCSRPTDIGPKQAAKRPDVMVIESGEVLLPGNLKFDCDLGLPKPSVYACLAETVILSMEGLNESFSLSRQLSMHKVKQIFQLAKKHGATLSEIRGPNGAITDQDVERCRTLALRRLQNWNPLQVLIPVVLKKAEKKRQRAEASSAV